MAILRDAGEPVGFFSFESRTAGFAAPIGAKLSDVQAVVHANTGTLNRESLLHHAGLHGWRFDRLVPDPSFRLLEQDVHGRSERSVIDLALGYEAYVADSRRGSRSLLKDIANRRRKLGREHGEIRFTFDVRDPGQLRRLMEWKSAQYRASGVWDVFAARWPRDLVEATFYLRSEGFAGVLSTLEAGDRVVALHYGLRSGPEFASWFPVYDPAMSLYSPGNMLLLELAQVAPTEGIARIDLGWGADAYKNRFRTHTEPLVSGWAHRSTVRGMAWGSGRRLRTAVLQPSVRKKLRKLRQIPGRGRS